MVYAKMQENLYFNLAVFPYPKLHVLPPTDLAIVQAACFPLVVVTAAPR